MEHDRPRQTEATLLTEEEAVNFVNECLAGSYNVEGIANWWNRPRTALNGLTPRQAWAGGQRNEVVELAKQTTS